MDVETKRMEDKKMSKYSSLNCCNNTFLDVAINVINEDKLRVCCLNCEKLFEIMITPHQYKIIKAFNK